MLGRQKLSAKFGTSLESKVQSNAAATKGNKLLGVICRYFQSRSKKVILKLHKSYVRPHLKYAVQTWCPHVKTGKDIMKRFNAEELNLFKDYVK